MIRIDCEDGCEDENISEYFVMQKQHFSAFLCTVLYSAADIWRVVLGECV